MGEFFLDFNFFMPVRVFSGEGCVIQHAAVLRRLGRRCLIITGGSSAVKCGALNDAMEAVGRHGIETSVFPGISPNPLVSQCQAAAFAAEAFKADFLIGIGGGSVMDATKAAAWLVTNNITDGDKLFTGEFRHAPLPTVMIGTTAGTGSEVDGTGVLTVDYTKRKRSFNSPLCFPRYAFADPAYTASMPRNLTISTALDAYCHAAEGWLSAGCGDVISAFGEKALSLIADGLYQLAENDGTPSPALREQLLYGSLYAGVVLSACGTCFPHPLGYCLTEDFQVPHGMACAVFLPDLLKRAAIFTPERYQRLVELSGGKQRLDKILDKLIYLEKPITMTSAQIAEYAKRWGNLKNFNRTPGGFTAEDAVGLFHTDFADTTDDDSCSM